MFRAMENILMEGKKACTVCQLRQIRRKAEILGKRRF